MTDCLLTRDFSIALQESLQNARDTVSIYSAFIKLGAFDWLTQVIRNGVDVEVVARWKMADLLVGASDLSVYEICREKGWKFGICQNFHGKSYMIDDKEVYLGSANLTHKGMYINSIGNIEIGTKLEPDSEEVGKIKLLLSQNVVWINDEIYQKLCEEISASEDKVPQSIDASWSSDIASLLKKDVNHIWVYELAFTTPNNLLTLDLKDPSTIHDLELFHLNANKLDAQELKQRFRESRLYLWVCCKLSKADEMNFGKFSHSLHNSLLDDPTPYRKVVKDLVANIFEWMEFLPEEFEITRYDVTKSAKLIPRN